MLINTKTVIECLKIVILITICILIDFKMAVIKFTVDRIRIYLAIERMEINDEI